MIFKVIENNISEVTNEAGAAIGKALEMIGLQGERHAKEALTQQGAVDTGRLRNSVTHQVISEDSVAIGTNVEYAPYIEFGTYKMDARPYIRPAIEDYMNEYKQIIENELKR